MNCVSPHQVIESVFSQRDFAQALFDRLLAGSGDVPGVTRDSYGPGETFAHRLVETYARQLDLEVQQDWAANTYVTLPGSDRARPRLIVGSHLDSVAHGGNFDGAAGVVAGLVAIAALKALGLRPQRDVTVMAIRGEESVWFQVSYIGSRAALGMLPQGALAARRIDTQQTLASHIAQCGGDPDALARGDRFLEPASVHAFLELHIEQAPSLVEAGKPVAIATGIPGNFRYTDARVEGRHDHVGTPRRFRRDAAMAASELAVALDRVWEEAEESQTPMAVTFGRFHTDAAAHGLTTVPGAFHFSLDVRAYDRAVLAGLEQQLHATIAAIEARRGVAFRLGARAQADVGEMSPRIMAALERAARELDIPAMRLRSPGSHDAAAFARAGIATGMIFVRNENGSHNPAEYMSIDDFLAAASVLAAWLVDETCR